MSIPDPRTLELANQAERGGPRGRRAARKLTAWIAGELAKRGDRCPYEKLTYVRWWWRGIDAARGVPHRTVRRRVDRRRWNHMLAALRRTPWPRPDWSTRVPYKESRPCL